MYLTREHPNAKDLYAFVLDVPAMLDAFRININSKSQPAGAEIPPELNASKSGYHTPATWQTRRRGSNRTAGKYCVHLALVLVSEEL